MLYLVSTPIGNLSDISLRALDVLKEADYILCEDTRHSRRLLDKYEIETPCRSYHKFNESQREAEVISDLQAGKQIALISDAGTPGIADPGERLVAACKSAGLEVSAVPGACALIHALVTSGLACIPFQFLGFLPKKKEQLQTCLQRALVYQGTSIGYESPHRIEKTLKLLEELDATRELVVARELTKKHESILSGTATQLLQACAEKPFKGEIVLLVSPYVESDSAEDWQDLTPADHVQKLSDSLGLSRKEALKLAAEQRGVSKRELYNQLTND